LTEVSFNHMTSTLPHIAVFAGTLACALGVCMGAWRRSYKRREQRLEAAVRQRTEELTREQVRASARSGILEMVVSNQSLGTVLDGVAKLIRDEFQGGHCAILLKQADRWHVGAAPGFPKEWMGALLTPHAVPFEVWKQPCQVPSPGAEPAWRLFRKTLTVPPPVFIHSCPIGGGGLALGAILLFEDQPVQSGTRTTCRRGEVLECAARVAQVAIEHQRLNDDLQFQAHHDHLTGLPNRTLFEDRLARACSEAGDMNQRLAVLSVDLDRFKQINDTTSHRIGDLSLCEIAARIRRAVRPGDMVARTGGDEFSILITNFKTAAEAEEIGERVLVAIREPMLVDGRALAATASVGIAIFPGDGTEADVLQREADAAMCCAKKSGRDRAQRFSDRNERLDCARLEQELHVALRDELFAVHYQPKIGVDGSFCGLEALLRLNHPVLGRVSPAEFIPVAEESGMIVPLGAWVLNEVCRQSAAWHSRGLEDVPIAVNVSSIQLARPDFARQVLDCLGRHGVSPWNIELELTESLLINSGEASRRQMQELRSIGVRFSIDDFGTGYSSLSYLHRLQVDAIKLDRSFVQFVDTDPAARRLVQAMIGVAEGLGLEVVAEGVETEAQRSALAAAGCPIMQGYLFARPQSALELESFLFGITSGPGDLLRIDRPTESGLRAA
jgi:diguanylate cyclase (GGDEF)-like protein